MSNLSQEQARQKISFSILLAISGLAAAAVIAVALAPALAGRPSGVVWALFIAEIIFGTSLVFASRSLQAGSTYISEKTQKPLRAVQSAGTTVWVFFVFFLVFNGSMAFGVGTASSISSMFSGQPLDWELVSQTALINLILVVVIYLVVVTRSETKGLKPERVEAKPAKDAE